ncbi:poliovirus receptor [Ictalurus punctatus]|uniref:Poliovirus receptor n=1 Tax=Ictalurus punctatus TaxID=7998 RepID=A0A2D0SS80_ICTPU|nr:poliovirus receptor [Ictalurus punctatus]
MCHFFSFSKSNCCLAVMASVMTNKATSLLIFISILQGTQSVFIEHKTEVNATVGQNISLPCIMSKEHPTIIQLQWHKEGEKEEQKLVVFNPSYSVLYYANHKLELVNETNTTELRGSILLLQEVTEKDSGNYVCDIASFPAGSIKTVTKVQVKVPEVSMKITSPERTVIEGDTVSITCVSDPPPDKYMLLSSRSQSIMESQDGKFTIQYITRHISDLICQPTWNSSNQRLQSLNATMYLTVDFLDNIECNSENQIQVETGTNLTITCDAMSSKSLHFVWMKDNITVSSNASINLWSVSPEHNGLYTLIVHNANHSRLHRQKDFTVTVLNSTHTEHLISTMIMETTPQTTMTTAHISTTITAQSSTTMTTAQNSTTITTPQPNVTMPTSQPHHTTDATSTEEVMNISTSAPSTGNITMVNVNITTPHTVVQSSATTFTHTSSEGRTLSEICCTSSPGSTSREITSVHPDTSTIILTSASINNATVRTSNVLTTIITRKDVSTTKSHGVFVIIPVFLMLVVIGFLYRQYLIQKRLDMPPPFKPPPPPVKYTSARNHDIPVTDILV